MIKEIKYTSIQRILDDLHDDSLMHDLTLEQAVRHTLRFIGKNGLPKMFLDKEAVVDIHEFRGLLPCDVVSIKQVKDLHSGICLRSMTDSFTTGMTPPPGTHVHPIGHPMHPVTGALMEHSFKTNNRVIFTSFPDGKVTVAYKAIPVDDDGFPLLIDNEVYLSALESYITMKVLQQKFRKGDINAQVYQDAKQEYAWDAAQLNSELMIPSVSEMESIARLWNSHLPSVTSFDRGFVDLGNREYMKKH